MRSGSKEPSLQQIGRELRILRGLVRQIGWYVRGGRDVALAKRQRGEKLK